jgi:hypothetical protein
MVFVARQALGFAAELAHRGAAAQEAQSLRTNYPATGLLWIRGLIAYGTGDVSTACDLFRAEEAFAQTRHSVYARESRIVASESLGFALLGERRYEAAREVFGQVLGESANRARARLGLILAQSAGGATSGDADAVVSACADLESSGKHVEQALVLAAAAAWRSEPAVAMQHAERVFSLTAADASGWNLPVDPIFAPLRLADGYPRLAARLAARAA